jgi:hypothetical protein
MVEVKILIQFVDKSPNQIAPSKPLLTPIPQPTQEPIKNKSPKKTTKK